MSPARAKGPKPQQILIPTALAAEGVAILNATPGFKIDLRPGLKGPELDRAIRLADAIIIRSEHKIDARTIAAAPRLRLIARAGVGVENVDVAAASARGIVVLNTPAANSIAVAELTMALMLALARKIVAADRSVKAGRWEKSAFGGHELWGKTLGLVGFGRIGREVAARAAAFGMHVIVTDPFVSEAAAKAAGVTLTTLPKLLQTADVVSLHLPLNDKTRGLMDSAQLRRLKKSALLINAARGGIIDEIELHRLLMAGKLAGCALDVFATEPPLNRWFAELDNVIVTPHLGASTAESQTKVAVEIANAVRLALTEGTFVNAVNLPIADPADLPRLHPYMQLAERLGLLLRTLERGPCDAITLEVGAQTSPESKLILAAALKGFLAPETDAPITLVNAVPIAAERHITVAIVDQSARPEAAQSLSLQARFGDATHRAVGTVENGASLKIRQIDDFPLDFVPEGRVLIFSNRDRPGVIGGVGAVLGNAKINIAAWTLGRKQRGGMALGIVAVDDPVPKPVLDELGRLPHMGKVVQVEWPAR